MKKNHIVLIFVAAMLAGIVGAGCSAKMKKSYYLERANRFFDSGQFAQAEVEYLNVLHADPQDAEAIGKLGIIYFDEGRIQKAAPYLYKGSQMSATNLDLHLKLGQIYLALGRLKDAHGEAETVFEKNPKDGDAIVLFAQSISKPNDLITTQNKLHSLAQNGDSAALETALGIVASHQHDNKTALADFQRALALDSRFAAAYAALGNMFWEQDETKKAEAAFKAAADCAPPHSLLQLQYGQFEIQAGNFTVAESFFTGLTEKTPDYVPAWLGLAEVTLNEKKLDDCATALNKVLMLDPDNVDGQVLHARLTLARSDIAQGRSELERLVKLYPQAPRIHYQLGLAYIEGGQIDKSLNQLHEAADLDPNFPEANFLMAQLELKNGNAESAIDLLRQLIKRQPNLVQARIILADAYRFQGNYNGALEIYQELEKAFPQNAQVPLLAGSTFIQQQNEAAARQEFNRALGIDPNNVSALEELAQLDLADGRFAAAQQRVDRVISQHPQEAQPQILLAKIYLEQGQTNQAEATLSKAATLPDGASANLLLAQLYLNSGQDQKAMDILSSILEKNPKDTASLMLSGMVQSDQKNYRAAADSYEKLLAINPNYSPALNNLACLYCDNLGDLDKAYDLAQRARQLLPNDPSTADTLGWVLFKKEQYLSSLKLFQSSADRLPNNPEVQYHLGVANYMLGNEDASRNALQSALNSTREFPDRGECQNDLNFLNIDAKTADATAQAILEKRISEKPNDPIAFARLVTIYQQNKNTDKAIALCETALKANPQNVRANVLLAQLYAPADPQKAFSFAKAAYQLKPDDTEVCATLGRLASQNGNDPWAYTLLNKASQNEPNDPQLLFDLANVAFSAGKIFEAQTAMQNAVQAGLPASQSVEAKNFLDMVTLCQSPDQAVVSESRVEEILASNPDSVPALFVSAIIKAQQGNPMGAERDYENLLAAHPNFALAQKNLAILYAQNLVDPDKAYPVVLKAREAFPDDAQVAKALALVLFQKGDYTRTVSLFNSISDSGNADAEVFYCLGISQFHLKNYVDSKNSLQRALSLNLSGPQATDARETLAELKN